MKNKILEGLKSKYPDVSTSILSRIADKLAKTVTKEEDVETAVEGVSIQSLIEAETDRRTNDVVHTAVANYEKKHGLKDGKPVSGDAGKEKKPDEEEGKKNELPDDTPAWAKALVAQNQELVSANKALADRITTMEGSTVASTRKQKLDKALEGASEKFKEDTYKAYKRMSFADDADHDSYLEEITTGASENAADTKAQGAVIGIPKTGGKNTKSDEIPASVMAGIKQGAAPAADAQPF